jgi:hypothetical protein
MQAKRRISRQIFDAAGHKSLETPAFKVSSSSACCVISDVGVSCAAASKSPCCVGTIKPRSHAASAQRPAGLAYKLSAVACSLRNACLTRPCACVPTLVLVVVLVCRSGLVPTSFGWCRMLPSASCGTCLAQLSTGAGARCPHPPRRCVVCVLVGQTARACGPQDSKCCKAATAAGFWCGCHNSCHGIIRGYRL